MLSAQLFFSSESRILRLANIWSCAPKANCGFHCGVSPDRMQSSMGSLLIQRRLSRRSSRDWICQNSISLRVATSCESRDKRGKSLTSKAAWICAHGMLWAARRFRGKPKTIRCRIVAIPAADFTAWSVRSDDPTLRENRDCQNSRNRESSMRLNKFFLAPRLFVLALFCALWPDAQAVFKLNVTSSPTRVSLGGTVTYSITVSNSVAQVQS